MLTIRYDGRAADVYSRLAWWGTWVFLMWLFWPVLPWLLIYPPCWVAVVPLWAIMVLGNVPAESKEMP